ncbi:MAG TPA: HdeD family acid-resistance protein [Candidatus Eisenbacteria bacterium]|nr:HdeD family acid-resistance protein [Candidatus Eisenbacteria bacterium]
MFQLLSRYWWVLVVRGLIAITVGVLAFTLPMETVIALALVFGACAFADGIFTIAMALAGQKISPDWWVLLLQGVLGVGIGALTLFQPAITATALLVNIAVWSVLIGTLQVSSAVKLRHEIPGEWWLALGGLLGVTFGVLILMRPTQGALAVLWMFASFAILWGVMLLASGFDIHRLWKHAAA